MVSEFSLCPAALPMRWGLGGEGRLGWVGGGSSVAISVDGENGDKEGT